uniref:Uncharacterized protein n=1 Tax=Arundo donax TaxID=35708 RepID=A0A0A9G7C5_ARUDO
MEIDTWALEPGYSSACRTTPGGARSFCRGRSAPSPKPTTPLSPCTSSGGGGGRRGCRKRTPSSSTCSENSWRRARPSRSIWRLR